MNRRQQGMSLIEILVSIAIIGAVLFLLAQSQMLSIRSTAQSRDISTAKAAATRALESAQTLVLQNFSGYASSCSTTPCTYPHTASGASYTVGKPEGNWTNGLLVITASADRPGSTPVRLAVYVSCYDIYPSPKTTAPAPCPATASVGSGL